MITDRQLDMAVLSETWHRSTGDVLVRLATPPHYTAVDAVRPDPNHGGLAIITHDDFTRSRIQLPHVTTFERLAMRVTIDVSTLVVISVYRPGSTKPTLVFC